MDLTYSAAEHSEAALGKPRLSLHYVFVLYRQQFWRWFSVTAPTSVIAAMTLLATDLKIREIYAAIPRSELVYHWPEIVLASALRLVAWVIAWFLGCFALGAIATIVSRLDEEQEISAWKSDSFQRAREHFLEILGVAVFTFCAVILGMTAMGIFEIALGRLAGWPLLLRHSSLLGVIGYLVVAGVVCWYGMAIPLLIRENIGIWESLKRSVKRSKGYEFFLFLLVLESLVGSYLAWYVAHYAIALLIPAVWRSTAWYGWVLYFASLLASAAVEPPMFIGFSVLANVNSVDRDLSPPSQQPPYID